MKEHNFFKGISALNNTPIHFDSVANILGDFRNIGIETKVMSHTMIDLIKDETKRLDQS